MMMYRLAQGVLDQEDVSETFLKALPSATDRYDVLYPVGSIRILISATLAYLSLPVNKSARLPESDLLGTPERLATAVREEATAAVSAAARVLQQMPAGVQLCSHTAMHALVPLLMRFEYPNQLQLMSCFMFATDFMVGGGSANGAAHGAAIPEHPAVLCRCHPSRFMHRALPLTECFC